MRLLAAIFGFALAAALPTAAFEIGQSLGSTETFGIATRTGTGKALASLKSVEKYDIPAGGFSVAVDWVGKNASWDALYSVQCLDGDGYNASVLDFDDDAYYYDVKNKRIPASGPLAFSRALWLAICEAVPGATKS